MGTFRRKAESARADVTHAREVLAAKASDTYWDRLMDYVNTVARAEGHAYVWGELAEAEEFNGTDYDLGQHLLSLALQSPNDTWGSRGNDARRSYADGRREAVEAARRYCTVLLEVKR